MNTLKYSKQREAIKRCLIGRTDHPTADIIYLEVRKEFPNISLGTVYRNLTLLSDIGEILRLRIGDGIDHFDGNPMPHYHFVCRECKQVIDLDIKAAESIVNIDKIDFDGNITGHFTYFYGDCPECCSKIQQA